MGGSVATKGGARESRPPPGGREKACLFLKDCLGKIVSRKESYEKKIVTKGEDSPESSGWKFASSLRVPEQLNASHAFEGLNKGLKTQLSAATSHEMECKA